MGIRPLLLCRGAVLNPAPDRPSNPVAVDWPKTTIVSEDDRMSASAVEGSAAPKLLANEAYKCIDVLLGRGSSSAVYSIKDYPNFAIKEIQIDDQDEGIVSIFKSELAALLRLSHPGSSDATRSLRTGALST